MLIFGYIWSVILASFAVEDCADQRNLAKVLDLLEKPIYYNCAVQVSGGAPLAYRCSGPTPGKNSTAFSQEQIKKGALRAESDLSIVYLTPTGIETVVFPTYYHFVKYKDGAIDVGVLPRNILPFFDGNQISYILEADGTVEYGTKVSNLKDLEAYSKRAFSISLAAAIRQYQNNYEKILVANALNLKDIKMHQNKAPEEVASCVERNLAMKYKLLASKAFYELNLEKYIFFGMSSDGNKLWEARSKGNQPLMADIRGRYEEEPEALEERIRLTIKNKTSACEGILDKDLLNQTMQELYQVFIQNYKISRDYVRSIN